MQHRILTILALVLFYLLYIEFSPGMGNIWWRDNKLFLAGAVSMFVNPLHNTTLWSPSLWDLNFIVWLIGFAFIDLSIKNYSFISMHAQLSPASRFMAT